MKNIRKGWSRILRAARRRLGGGRGDHQVLSSADYWRERYAGGGNSGPGSYNHLAVFKADVLNDFVASRTIADVLEFGCGDGHQLSLAKYPSYTGYDITAEAIALCRAKFQHDASKSFFTVEEYDGRQADLALSLDVIFHLLEDAVFEAYMHRLLSAARRHVIVYSSDKDEPIDPQAPHVRHRKFTEWISRERPEWTLLERIPNRYPYDGDWRRTSFADFFVFGRSHS